MAEALYRKYRPQIFEDVVGQEHIERTLKNAIERDKVSHAYLFCGPRGTGKTTTARLLAKALLCEKDPTPEPDGTCENCTAIANGTHPDVYELDAASRTGVENVREEIIGRVQFAPTQGRYKVYIIDEVHMLSTAAFNSLLKTLEEPPSHVVFILCTTDPQKVPETIHSRCQRFDFHRISSEAIVSRLGAICVAEDVEFEGEALDLIAYRAEGGMRNALTSLEQVITFGEGKVTLETAERLLGSLDTSDMVEIVDAIGRRDIVSCFNWTDGFMETGADLAQFVRDLAEHIRNIYILSLSDSDTALEVSEAVRREMAQQLKLFSPDRLARMLGVLGNLASELRTSINPRLSFEIALTRLVRPDSDLTLEALAERIEVLERQLAADAFQVSKTTAVGEQARNKPQTGVAVGEEQGYVPESKNEPDDFEFEEASDSMQPDIQEADHRPCTTNLENPAALQRVWQSALQAIKQGKAAYGVLFLNTGVRFDNQTKEVIIEFPAENEFAFAAVQKSDAMALIKQSLQNAAGAPVEFRLTQLSQDAAIADQEMCKESEQSSAVLQKSTQSPDQQLSDQADDQQPNQAGAQQLPVPITAKQSDNDRPQETQVPTDNSFLQDDSPPIDAYNDIALSMGDGDHTIDNDDVRAVIVETYGTGVVFQEVDND